VREHDQINLTDEDSRIMKVAGGGFEQCYNAQAVVATGSMLVVATEVTQAANDKEQLVPMIEKIQALPKELGYAKRMLADSGYLSQANVEQCESANIEPLIALGRSRHHVSWKQRFAAAPKSPPESATPMQKMAHRLKTPRGRKLYALRKQTPEPVFGIIKSVMGYRQCLLRGLENVRGEWNLVTMSWNIRRMFAMQPC
jgi:IS5 family transposase